MYIHTHKRVESIGIEQSIKCKIFSEKYVLFVMRLLIASNIIIKYSGAELPLEMFT